MGSYFYIIPSVSCVQFGLCFIRIFYFFLLCFLFLLVFFLTDTNDSPDYREGRGSPYFLVFHVHPLTIIHLVNRDFNHFCLIDLFVITRLIADETCSPQRFAFYLHFHWCNQVEVIVFDISKWHCEDLSSYQTITLLLQSEHLNHYVLFLYCGLFCW